MRQELTKIEVEIAKKMHYNMLWKSPEGRYECAEKFSLVNRLKIWYDNCRKSSDEYRMILHYQHGEVSKWS